MRKMGPKGARKGPGRPVSDFFSTKYASTLIYVLPKPPTIYAYEYPEAAVKEGDRRRATEKIERIKRRASRDTFELDTRERRLRLPEISSP